MYIKLSQFTLACLLLLVSLLVYADSTLQSTLNLNQNPADVVAYWTPERLRSAIPVDENNVDVTRIQTSTMMSSNSFDAGSLGHFTSQPLIPLAANTVYPYSTIGKMFFTGPMGSQTCTAFVIRKRVVVTAVNCLQGTNTVFIPGYRDGAAPFGTWVQDTRLISSNKDYGLFTVADQSINGTLKSVGDIVGMLNYQINTSFPHHAYLFGYPSNLDSGQNMHQVAAQSAFSLSQNYVIYGSDMNLGATGGPIIQNFGIASSGTEGGVNPARNTAVGFILNADPASMGNLGVLFTPIFDQLVKNICGLKVGNC